MHTCVPSYTSVRCINGGKNQAHDRGWVRHSTWANAWVCRARNTALSNCLLPCRPPFDPSSPPLLPLLASFPRNGGSPPPPLQAFIGVALLSEAKREPNIVLPVHPSPGYVRVHHCHVPIPRILHVAIVPGPAPLSLLGIGGDFCYLWMVMKKGGMWSGWRPRLGELFFKEIESRAWWVTGFVWCVCVYVCVDLVAVRWISRVRNFIKDPFLG